MKFADYFLDRIFSVACCIFAGLLLLGLLWLIEVPTVFIVFSEAILLVAFGISFLWDFQRRSRYYNQLLTLLDLLDEKTLLTELAERPYFLDGQILLDILQKNSKYQNDKISETQKLNRDYRDFLDTWVHEIKTPITSARLIVENEKNPTTIKIDDELRKIDHFVELVLYYARSRDVEKDFKIEKTTATSLVNRALKTYSKALIQTQCHIHTEQLDIPVFADTKSGAFLIGQIISNAIKYRRENFVLKFSTRIEENRLCLLIQDNGMGIAAADLHRVFDKGFTGENGRRFPQSTGIGLYLCKRLCDKMNVGLSIESIEGAETTVTLYFPTESLLREADI
jgi:signal transduction histidine kinase